MAVTLGPAAVVELQQWAQYKRDLFATLLSGSPDTRRAHVALDAMFPKWLMMHSRGQQTDMPVSLPPADDVQHLVKEHCSRHTSWQSVYSRVKALPVPSVDLLAIVPHSDSTSPLPYLPLFSGWQEGRLRRLYVSDDEEAFFQDRNLLAHLYAFLGGTNNHLGIPPLVLAGLSAMHGGVRPIVECFGSPFNTVSSYYCSPLALEKARFNSMGSFFSMQWLPGRLYVLNPPFSEALMLDAANRLLEGLATCDTVTAIVVLPVWDSLSQRKHGLTDKGRRFEAYEVLSTSRFCQDTRVLDKHRYPFYEYGQECYIPASHSHLLLLSNEDAAMDGDSTGSVLDKCLQCWMMAASKRQSK